MDLALTMKRIWQKGEAHGERSRPGQTRQGKAAGPKRRKQHSWVEETVWPVLCSTLTVQGCRVRIAAAVMTPNGKAVRGCAMNLVR